MDSTASDVEFALIGHQDSWQKISSFVNMLRNNSNDLEIPKKKLAEVYSYFPPCSLFDIEVKSITGKIARGKYIETFISPDELNLKYWKNNIAKVNEAAECASKLQAGIAALGGFTSIVLEGRVDSLNKNPFTKFTTGNTLTAAYIVKSLENACMIFNKEIKDQNLLIIGSTGDIGSACVSYFAGKVKKLLLCARQQNILLQQEKKLSENKIPAKASIDVEALLPHADIIIAIASSMIENFNTGLCNRDVIICDAGYPKNLDCKLPENLSERMFCGGMGIVKGGYNFTPDFHAGLYKFPDKNIAHGCLLEAIVLSMENKQLAYSTGKGNITPEKIEEIYAMGKRHGITEAPLFNLNGLWN
jgi:predicted amino acid dehydrogenase